MARSKSSQSWLKEHHQDQYVLQARRDGYRSRAVYKLDEIQQKDRIFAPGQHILDLGAAPGGWCEYASQYSDHEGSIIAVDILPIEPIAGVDIIQGDFTEQETLDRIMAIIDAKHLDLVLSDMAPNLSGMGSVDQPRSIYLAELALELASECLQERGILVTKLFQGEGFDSLISNFRDRFGSVKLRKPSASRARSREVYAVCRDLK
ncbi:MAG: 23S rRNA (uridine(2552)-2'-O)-methyltransferase RlmE [Gammaproteobacteria bacterium]|nr:23S rRNA (uridine(2552)-2'-O)-methyltransferase RlmE [Gammaproteobacteria bacterium]